MRAGKGRHISLTMPKGQSLNHRSLRFPRVLLIMNDKLALEHPLRTIYGGSKAVILWPLKVVGYSLHFPAISKGAHALSNNGKGKQGHGHIRGRSLFVLKPTGSCTGVEAAEAFFVLL